MGDRISIAFADGEDESIAFFSHSDGESLLNVVGEYLTEYNSKHDRARKLMPLDRFEPNTVMVDFIRWMAVKGLLGEEVEHNYYLGRDSYDGDNSDNGHYIFYRDGSSIK